MMKVNLTQSMQSLLYESKQPNADMKQIIGKAVQLGMNYQESIIKDGIAIVFESLHKNTNNK